MLKIGTKVYLKSKYDLDNLVYENLQNGTADRIIEPFIIVERSDSNSYAVCQDFGADGTNHKAWIKEEDLITNKEDFIELVKETYDYLKYHYQIDNPTEVES